MSQVLSVDNEEVQYVFNGTDFILDPSDIKSEGLSDIIYSDGTRAILVNGQILQNDTETVVLQDGDDLSQYYINEETGHILIKDGQDSSTSHSFDGAEIVQYIDTEENAAEEHQIIYINEEGNAIQEPDLPEYQIAETQEDENTFPLKAIKLETQVVDLEELIRQQGDGEPAIIESLGEDNGYQYAILKDGKLHIQAYTGDVFPIAEESDAQEQDTVDKSKPPSQVIDISKITGRNLLTGQTVTLHSYMDKLQKKIQNTVEPISKDTNGCESRPKGRGKQQVGLKSLLNKKLALGRTTSGKRLVGKIIHVEKKDASSSVRNDSIEETNLQIESDVLGISTSMEITNDDSSISKPENISNNTIMEDDSPDNTPKRASKEDLVLSSAKRKIVIHEKIVSKECFDHISRTLSGLMNMESVRKKLEYKNIIVKVVEKKFMHSTKMYTKNVSYSSGCMQSEITINSDEEAVENWHFEPDPNTKEAIFGKVMDDDDDSVPEPERYLATTNITLMITHGKNNDRVIRVILNPAYKNKCVVCSKEFRSHLQMRFHMNNVHRTSDCSKICEICNDNFEDRNNLQEHRKMHVQEGKLFQCTEQGCGKFFLTVGRLKRHNSVHNMAMRPLECSVCLHRCSSESSLKKHLMTHMNVRPFYCTTCEKSFSNQGDLNFHKRIHDPCKYFACEICKRTFSRHSNLQRHVEIHKGSGDLFWCTICGCSYHYMSSLTRHVVQNHIKRTEELESTEMSVEDEAPDS